MKIQKKNVKSSCFDDKFVLKIADLLSFATVLCFDFHFCEGQGKKFRILKSHDGTSYKLTHLNGLVR